MTNETFEYLKKYEWLWDITVHAKYNRRVPTNELQELGRIYKELTKDKSPLNLNCNTCVFAFERRLGVLYYEEQKKRADIAAKQVLINSQFSVSNVPEFVYNYIDKTNYTSSQVNILQSKLNLTGGLLCSGERTETL